MARHAIYFLFLFSNCLHERANFYTTPGVLRRLYNKARQYKGGEKLIGWEDTTI